MTTRKRPKTRTGRARRATRKIQDAYQGPGPFNGMTKELFVINMLASALRLTACNSLGLEYLRENPERGSRELHALFNKLCAAGLIDLIRVGSALDSAGVGSMVADINEELARTKPRVSP